MDDDDARTGGSLPDPGDRLWRHPSELAAGAGTAPIGPIDGGGSAVGSRTVAAIAVAAGAIYLSWYFAGSTSGQSVFSESAIQAVSTTTVATTALESSRLQSVFDLAESDETSSLIADSSILESDEASSDRGASSADALDAKPSTPVIETPDDNLTSYSGQAIAPLLKSPSREVIEQRQVGLYEDRTGREPLARFVAHNGMLVTSASALAGRHELSVWDTNGWLAASVQAVDRISDIAVLKPENWTAQLDALAGTIDADPAPLAPNQTVMVKPTTLSRLSDLDADGRIDNTDVDVGAVVGVGERVVHGGAHAIYDGARTTIEFQSSLAGGRLLDEGDRTVGMIINADSWSLAAMPIESALDIARSLGTTGQAATSWIGLGATTDETGAARVVWVEPDGPSAEEISRGDIIETWNGEAVVDADHLVHHVRRAPAQLPVELGIRRYGRPENATLVPAPIPVTD